MKLTWKTYVAIAIGVIAVAIGVYFLIPKKSCNSEETVDYEIAGITLTLPKKISVKIEDDTVYLIDHVYVSDFLKGIQPPKGTALFASGSFAEANGNKSFILKHDMYAEYNLLFCADSGEYQAVYIAQDGTVPKKITDSFSSINRDNSWQAGRIFEFGTTTIIGQYHDKKTEENATTFEFKVNYRRDPSER